MIDLRHNLPYYIIYLFYLIIGCIIISETTRIGLFLTLNQHHTPNLDTFFSLITHLGTPIFTILLLGGGNKKLLYKNKNALIFYLITGAVLYISILGLKLYFHHPRPMSYESISSVYTPVSNLPILYANSYPSGHTATIFYTVTAYLLVNKSVPLIQVLLLGLAILVGYSRIYVGAHFAEDVLMGSYIGVSIPTFIYCFYSKQIDAVFR